MEAEKAISSAPAWQREWGESFRTLGSLLDYLGLDPAAAPSALLPDPAFALRVPRAFAARMTPGDWGDPLLRQVLPLGQELEEKEGFVPDAVGDGRAQAAPGLLRKYRGRALLVLNGHCAVHCRYCFRREFPYGEIPARRAEWDGVYARLARDPSLEEVIFSGGDPLSLSDSALRWHGERALALPRVRRLRIHTRLPVALPGRVDDSFLDLISEWAARRPLVMVLHVNHAREIDAGAEKAFHALRRTGALLLNQAVLLRGVNDSAAGLEGLSRRLLEAGVLPYYLHQLDRVRGAVHFEVDPSEGLALMEELRKRLPGYALPRYVRELPGEESKIEVGALREICDAAPR